MGKHAPEYLEDKVLTLIKLMEANVSNSWTFDLEMTYECIIVEDGVNRHEDDQYTEVYTGARIWQLVEEIKKEIYGR